MNKKTIAMVFFIVLLAHNSFSIGIAPSTTNIQFEPGKNLSVLVRLFNNNHEDFNAEISVVGDLSKYIILSEPTIHFKKDDNIKNFTYSINLPQRLEKPGTHKVEIYVRERLVPEPGIDIRIQPTIGVVTQLFVYSPYPDKYVEAGIKTQDITLGEDIAFTITVANRGKLNISRAYAEINISDKGIVLRSIKTSEIAIKGSAVLNASVNSTGMIPGDYDVSAVLYYDGNETKMKTSFSIVDFMIDLLSINSPAFELGKVAQLDIKMKNIGNRKLQDITSHLILSDKNGRKAADINGLNINLSEGDTGSAQMFWDTKDIDKGLYTGTITIGYEDRTLTQNISAGVNSSRIVFDINPSPERLSYLKEQFKAAEITEKPKSNAGFIIALLILLIAAAITYWEWKKRRRKD